ncbi:MAG: phospholipase D-like domain-containing protein, partial [Aeromicrobium sp.]
MRRIGSVLGSGVLAGALALGLTSTTAPAGAEEPTPSESASAATTPDPESAATTPDTTPEDTTPDGSTSESEVLAASGSPYGSAFPVTLETNFARPYKAISSSANSDFSQLDDLERLIRGSYRKPDGSLRYDRTSNTVKLSISRMENSHRVGRELIRAAQNGVEVYVIHGVKSQSSESRALQRKLNSLKHGHFKICDKGKSNACLSSLKGAIMHTKILIINRTYTRNNKSAQGVIWSGSANLGGPSGERTYNNGLTVYNDRKLYTQATKMWSDMSAEKSVGNDYFGYIRGHKSSYGGYFGDVGYTNNFATSGMFYSNLANVTIYPTPIAATPTNGKDPVLKMLSRIVPDDQCRIRLQQNRFKYRRIAVAQKLVQLADQGCKVSAVSFQDDLQVNRTMHCQQYIRICKPILDTFKTANSRIDVGWAKPHDKTILVDAVLTKNMLNPEELPPNGGVW